MLLVTRCPFCETVSRTQPASVSAHRGQARCGHCHASFDVAGNLFELPEGGGLQNAKPVLAGRLASLISGTPIENKNKNENKTGSGSGNESTGNPEPAQPAAQPPSATSPDAGAHIDFSSRKWDPWAPRPAACVGASLHASLHYGIHNLPRSSLIFGIHTVPRNHTVSRVTVSGLPSANAPASAAIATSAMPAPAPITSHVPQQRQEPPVPHIATPPANEPLAVAPSSDAKGNAPHFVITHEAPVRHERRSGVWRVAGALVALLLLALICVALAWSQRETVMIHWPASQSLYRAVCARAGCHALPVRDIDGLGVAQPALLQTDDAHHLALTVPIRNHLNVALAWPAISLTLYDAQNHVVERRVLRPQDYVTPAATIDAGIAAHSTQTMTVAIATDSATASNFHLEILYP